MGIYLANGGGITQKVSQNLGLRDGIVQVYNENAATNKVYASITGYWASDRTNADGKYLILGLEGKEFIVSNGKGIYKTGEQIITSKVTTSVGEAARTEIRNITFNDEDAVAPLQELQEAYPGAEIYLNGELAIDFPEDVKIPISPNQMVTASVVGSRVKFSYCGLGDAIAQRLRKQTTQCLSFAEIALLREQYAVGSVEVKIVQAKTF